MHVWTAGYFAYILGLMHYLDKSTASALASFPLFSLLLRLQATTPLKTSLRTRTSPINWRLSLLAQHSSPHL